MTILVTGATGSVGRTVVDRLLAAGERVRALTRTPETAGLPDGVEVVRGDLTQPAALGPALDGVDRAYLFPVADGARTFVELAEEAGVRRIVTLSSQSVELRLATNREASAYHRAVEEAVEAGNVEWTHLRPGGFTSNVLWWAPSIQAEGVVRGPYARAAQALVHPADIAEVAVAALLEDGHAGRAYTLLGPRALDQAEQVRAIGEGIGRELRFEEVTPEQAREAMLPFVPADVIDMVFGYLAHSVDHPDRPEPVIERLLGRPARTLTDWAAENAEQFR
ncbi:NAD(P)H-binding protein [Allostreptomyces psammosilenae]|uniref:Uncharacterized protein YbjT (DUF2867 family) n=1 Tax=Allostreptomyces psammosilenae TaxID=1892865 RepID=A0A853A4R0_9ACTN|nr:NAD(P)H-binding protein [Allostreptomyces psammosilenae]NYI05478.1 uncharacterized protein YbjT (DUF2867 family) [Allostreptomyces psammosilenae]